MPDEFTDAPSGDDVDFRPLPSQPPQRKSAPQPRQIATNDGIDFQPAKSARPAAQASTDGIDFRPAEKPATFDTLYRTLQPGPTLTERAAHVGESSPDVRAFAPQYADLTQVPVDPFTNRYITRPPIATEEEKQRMGTISALQPGFLDRVKRALGAGAPEGSLMARWTGQRGQREGMRLLAPEQLMTEAEQARHPILTGAGEFAGGLTTPESVMLIAMTAGAGTLTGPAVQTAKQLLAAGFTAQMLTSAMEKVPEISDAIKRGDTYNAQRLATHALLETATAGLAGRGMLPGEAPIVLREGEVSGPLAMDQATTRGARRIEDFAANAAARQGMSRLAEAERGIEAARQARINAPVEVPKAYQGEPPILPGPRLGPERNPLEVEAARVREERTAQPQDYRVLDLRRVVPEEPSQPPYYEIAPAEPRGPARPVEPRGPARPVEPAPAGETVGARGRPQRIEDLATRALNDQEAVLLKRFGPEVLEQARQEIRAAADMATSMERPGRYFAGVGQTDEGFIKESPKEGIRHGGSWYGVTSMRDFVAGQFPWYGEIAEGPEKLAELAEGQKGAAYNRILERVAEGIANERESARPIIEEYAPQLRSLAEQIRNTDPELAQTMQDLSAGKAVGFHNLREYIEGKIDDAKAAAIFSQAVDEAGSEASAAEPVRLGGEARPGEARSEAPPSEPAGAIDFQALPETEAPFPRFTSAARANLALRGERPVTPEDRLVTLKEQRDYLRGREQLAAQASPEERAAHERELAAVEREIAELEGKAPLERFREPRQPESQRLREPGEEPAEFYSGIHPRVLVEGARVLQRAWEERVAKPFIDRVLKIGEKYQKAREADPAVAEGLHLLDNAPTYLRAKAAQHVHDIIGSLSRAQERLFTLMADAESRENLRTNHPEEYARAQSDPAIQEALRKYRPIEQELTQLRARMGGEVLDQDYLRRVYEKHVAGVNKPEAPSTSGERATSAFDRVIRPQRIGNLSREATAEYHYQSGLHELGPAFATKFVGTHLRALRDSVAREFMDKATMLPAGASEPRFIMYNGERYYRPDLAREMRTSGGKNVKEYDRYDPTAGEKFPVAAEGKFLGPRELVNALNDYGRREEGQSGALRRFFQEQILGFGFGVPHIANIMRRVSQSVPGGAANPKGWVEAWRVVLSKELRDRGIAGLDDPTFDMLARHGAISTGEWATLKEYWGGNLNPANWARKFAGIGHRVLFEPGSAGGFGGIDQRARLYIADLVRSQRPDLTDSQIAEAVRTRLGDYNRANWTDRQKMLARFMMFPGWDFSSVKWVLQHPIKTTVPPALVVLLANQVLHQLGQNRPEDQYDIFNVHLGDRAYGTSLIRESVARNLFRPALAYAQAKIRGESDQRAMAEAARGVTAGAGGLLSMVRPDLSGFLAMATNRQALFSGRELVSRDDFAQPGKLLPSRAVEKEAVFALRHAVPALDRMLDSNEDIDLRSFAGGNLGVPNYRADAEKRLYRNAAEAEAVHRTIAKLAKTNPALARDYVKDPDNAAFALFYHDLNGLVSTLKRMEEAKQRIEASGLSSEEKQKRVATIDHARENLLRHADGLSNLLFERREKARPEGQLFRPGFLKRVQQLYQPGEEAQP